MFYKCYGSGFEGSGYDSGCVGVDYSGFRILNFLLLRV
jgi:hypothetical protein